MSVCRKKKKKGKKKHKVRERLYWITWQLMTSLKFSAI